jgi:hypothetical protein
MSDVPGPTTSQDRRAATKAAVGDGPSRAALHSWLEDLLPAAAALVLDVGDGTGRDAIWLAGLGHDVVAVEPSAAKHSECERPYPPPTHAG